MDAGYGLCEFGLEAHQVIVRYGYVVASSSECVLGLITVWVRFDAGCALVHCTIMFVSRCANLLVQARREADEECFELKTLRLPGSSSRAREVK